MDIPLEAVYINVADVRSSEDGTETIDHEKFPGSAGVTYELCAGIVDKDGSKEQIAQEEVLEETGYKVPLDSIEKISSFRYVCFSSGKGAINRIFILLLFYTGNSSGQQEIMRVFGGNPVVVVYHDTILAINTTLGNI